MRQSHLLAAHNPKLPHTPLLCQLPMAFWRRSTFKQGSLQLNSVFFFFPAPASTIHASCPCVGLCVCFMLKNARPKITQWRFSQRKAEVCEEKTLKNPLNGTRMWNITQQKGKKNELMRHPRFSCQGDNIWLVSKTQSALTASSTPHPSSQPPVQHPPFLWGQPGPLPQRYAGETTVRVI